MTKRKPLLDPPCPFCGHDCCEAVSDRSSGCTMVWFECIRCGAASGPAPADEGPNKFLTAAKKWNMSDDFCKWQPIRWMPLEEVVLVTSCHDEDCEIEIVSAYDRDDVIELARRYTHFLRIWPLPDFVPRPVNGANE